MPVSLGSSIPDPNKELDALIGIMPDIAPGSKISYPVRHSMQAPEGIPPNFDELPEEEKERLRNVCRFQGIRLRSDVKDRTIPLTSRTMDVP